MESHNTTMKSLDFKIEEILLEMIQNRVEDGDAEDYYMNELLADAHVENFASAGVLTNNRGVQIMCRNGFVIQLTIASH